MGAVPPLPGPQQHILHGVFEVLAGQGAPRAPALGLAMHSSRLSWAAARQDRSVRRRGPVQADATRLYSAGLGASQRALTGAKALRIPQRRFYQEKIPAPFKFQLTVLRKPLVVIE